METPEKIYVHIKHGKVLNTWNDVWIGVNDVEYTHADTFIEKACCWLRENKDKYLFNRGGHGEYIPTCSDKLIEDFEKYMKGE